MNREIAIAVALLCLLAWSARAQQNCTPIHFARGQSSVIVKGVTRSSDTAMACFTLTTASGQTATLAIQTRSPDEDAAFTIPEVVDNQDHYTFKTEAKTYQILVYHTLRRSPDLPFTMRVTVR